MDSVEQISSIFFFYWLKLATTKRFRRHQKIHCVHFYTISIESGLIRPQCLMVDVQPWPSVHFASGLFMWTSVWTLLHVVSFACGLLLHVDSFHTISFSCGLLVFAPRLYRGCGPLASCSSEKIKSFLLFIIRN